MPLAKGSSDKAFRSNVRQLVSENYPQKQALAIAYRIKREKRAEGGALPRTPRYASELLPLSDHDGEMRSYTPRPSERLTGALQDVFGAMGAKPHVARHLGSGVSNIAQYMTPVGLVTGVADLAESQSGDHSLTEQVLAAPAALGPPGKALAKVASGIRAYHGSPHDFDKFSLAHIGKGEGAQAYGHGLYFAENEGVAKAYREGLAGKPVGLTAKLDGTEQWWNASAPDRAGMSELWGRISPYKIESEADAARIMSRAKTELEKTISNVEGGHIKVPKYDEDAYRQALRLLSEGRVNFEPPKTPGRMYEVNIHARPEQFLDWDRPLAQMSPEVRGRLKDAWLAHPEAHSHQRGQEIWQAGVAGKSYNPGEALSTFREAGIPGIRYLDQGSRATPARNLDAYRGELANSEAILAAEQRKPNNQEAIDFWTKQVDDVKQAIAAAESARPTSNYVVFDDSLIDILRKYGLAGVPAAGVAGAAISNDNGMKKGGAVTNPALDIAYRIRRAKGGPAPAPWQTRNAARSMVHSGPILSAVAGRTDHHPMSVRPNSYVLPADHVSSLGQGNTSSGMAVLNQMFGNQGPYGMGRTLSPRRGGPSIPRPPRARADGGATDGDEPVPIYAAGGEYVVEPEIVMEIGGGDIKRGHAILDNWVLSNRKKHISTLKKLPGPAKS